MVMVIVMIVLVNVVIVMTGRRHVPLARRYRIRYRRVFVCLRCRHAGRLPCRDQPRDDVLGIVANQEAATHQFVDRLDDLVPILRVEIVSFFY